MLRTDRLITLRKSKGLIQQQMADFLQITRSAYVRYEKGHNQPPNDALAKIADYFDVSADYLLGLTNDPTPPTRNNSQPDISDESLKFALWGTTDINDAVLDDVRRFAKFALEDEANKGKQGREGNENPK